jgi:hypothetical protein
MPHLSCQSQMMRLCWNTVSAPALFVKRLSRKFHSSNQEMSRMVCASTVPMRTNSESTLVDAKSIADKLSATHYSRDGAQIRRNVPSDVYRMVRSLRKFKAVPGAPSLERIPTSDSDTRPEDHTQGMGSRGKDQQQVHRRTAARESFVYPPTIIHLSPSGTLDNACQPAHSHRGLRYLFHSARRLPANTFDSAHVAPLCQIYYVYISILLSAPPWSGFVIFPHDLVAEYMTDAHINPMYIPWPSLVASCTQCAAPCCKVMHKCFFCPQSLWLQPMCTYVHTEMHGEIIDPHKYA